MILMELTYNNFVGIREITHTLEMCGKENMTLFIFSRAPIFMDIVEECKMKEFKELLVSFETT